jgi:Zn ribbon nucleic-acid-binding protein
VKKEISDVECFKCGHKGHYANDPVCPKFTVKKSDEQAADASTIRMVRKPEESEVCVFDDAEANAVLDLLRVPYND